MAELEKVIFTGKSGKTYNFTGYDIKSSWNNVPVVYIVTRRINNSKGGYNHTVIYIGQTENLKDRFSNHHKQECFDRNEANCLCVFQVSGETERLSVETDLLEAYKTECND